MRTMFTIEYKRPIRPDEVEKYGGVYRNQDDINVESTSCFEADTTNELFTQLFAEYAHALKYDPNAKLLFEGVCSINHYKKED